MHFKMRYCMPYLCKNQLSYKIDIVVNITYFLLAEIEF